MKVRSYNPTADLNAVEQAYRFSAKVHRGQKRLSGEPYLTHPMAVASLIADMKLDVPTVVTGLLHDTVEDTLATVDEIGERFGPEVAGLVDGVTKISRMESGEQAAAEAENLRKMFIASAKDIRVLLVKLADRAHNLRTVDHLPQERRKKMAAESLDLYAPLANRLGIHWLKSEFEETAFRVLWEKEQRRIRETLALSRVERDGYIGEVCGLMTKRLKEAAIDAEVSGRPKLAYSIYRKMKEQGLDYDEIHDVVGFRVLVDSERECYDALGLIHGNWRPVPGRFRDYVALPKANLYQSLHTTVIGPYGERMEVQVRTHEMHRVAEFGIAAHWRYKSSSDKDSDENERLEWLQRLLEWPQQVEDPRQLLLTFKEDLFADEVIVFTPKGEPLTFSKGETVVDFAYRIHSEVGEHCAGARVNGQLTPLRYQLQAGDTVEVITTEDQTPSSDWLKFVRSPRAKERIMGHLKNAEKARARALGRKLFERDVGRHQLSVAKLQREGRMAELLKRFNRSEEKELFEAVGYGRVTTKQVLDFLVPGVAAEPTLPKRALKSLLRFLERRPSRGVVVNADEEAMVHFAKCCQPLPGEDIVGFLTRGRGVMVHSVDCSRLAGARSERILEVEWEKGSRAPRHVKIEVTSRDRPGLLAGMSQAIASAGVNIDKAYVRGAGKDAALNVFDLTLSTSEDFARVVRNLRRVPGVKDVRRVRT